MIYAILIIAMIVSGAIGFYAGFNDALKKIGMCFKWHFILKSKGKHQEADEILDTVHSILGQASRE